MIDNVESGALLTDFALSLILVCLPLSTRILSDLQNKTEHDLLTLQKYLHMDFI